jgi:hypothetical protein
MVHFSINLVSTKDYRLVLAGFTVSHLSASIADQGFVK